MTSREESTTSKLTMHSDVNMTDEAYTLHKDGLKCDNLSSNLSAGSPTSNSAREARGDPHMDPTRRAMLNEFGLVHHAVLQSPEHNTVHVIYDHTNKHFVHSELTEELKTRTGLQLVPPQSRVATSLSTADSVLIVIVDRHDSVTDRLLRQAVETSGHHATNILFIYRGHTSRSVWVHETFSRTIMVSPVSHMESGRLFLERQVAVPSKASEAALFWDHVCGMISGSIYLDIVYHSQTHNNTYILTHVQATK